MGGSRDNEDLVALHEPFETALRGFNRRQVLEHLESLDGRFAVLAADRDAALTQVAELTKVMNHLRLQSELLEHLRREADHATSRVERVLATPMAEASARIQRIIRLAEEEAAEFKADAEAYIDAWRTHADQEIAELRASADEQIASLRADASREAKSLLEHAKRQCEQLEADSAARREVALQDAAHAIAQRESAASAGMRDRELRSLARLHLMLQEIGGQLAIRVGAVQREEAGLDGLRTQVANEVTALEELRTEVTTSLTSAYQVLTEALGHMRRVPAAGSAEEQVPPIEAPVPIQRSSEGAAVYVLNTGAEDRQSPRTSR